MLFFALSSFGAQGVLAREKHVQGDSVLVAAPVSTPQISKNSSSNLAYTLGSGDKVSITVYGESDLTGSYTVSNVGMISMPLIGQVNAKDVSLSELENIIADKLRDGYLKTPSVSAQISEYRPFYILGEVRTPGSYSFVSDMSVLNAVALAGGFTYRADKKTVEILRSKQRTSKIVRKIKVNERLKPGDIILVRERFF